MVCLLTGATGFLGQRLVSLLAAARHEVHYLSRQPGKTLPGNAQFHLWPDLMAAPPKLAGIPPCDAVFHLAGEPIAQRWTPAVKKRIEETRILGTRNLVAALAELPVRPSVLIGASAIGYYGDRGDQVLSEESAPGTGFLAALCAQWEREIDRAATLGLRVVKIRIGVVLGGEGGALRQMLPPFRAGVGARLGDGRQWMSWIERDDLLRMLLWAAGNDYVTGPLNGTAPAPVTNAEFTRELARILHRPAPFAAPRFALRLMLGEMADFLFDSIRAEPRAPSRLGFEFTCPGLEAALRTALRKTP